MDKQLLQKYFRNQCTIEEIEQVLDWFQTKEGQQYFEENVNLDMHRYAEEERLLLFPDVPSKKILNRIQQTRKKKFQKKDPHNRRIRAVVALLICSILSVNYLILNSLEQNNSHEPEITFRTISTSNDQHRLVTLSDGTSVRLNSNSSIEVPEYFPPNERDVKLEGEAWFDVARDENRPFSVQADDATIRVLGTEFNVKVDSLSRNVQIAVAEGRVSLSNKSNKEGRGAILTENTFAILNLDNEEILIEQTQVDNYLSWISGRLYFYNEQLWVVSRYLERIYNVNFRFEEEQLKNLPLSTDFAKDDLIPVLDIIGKTLRIDYHYENETVLWKETTNANH